MDGPLARALNCLSTFSYRSVVAADGLHACGVTFGAAAANNGAAAGAENEGGVFCGNEPPNANAGELKLRPCMPTESELNPPPAPPALGAANAGEAAAGVAPAPNGEGATAPNDDGAPLLSLISPQPSNLQK